MFETIYRYVVPFKHAKETFKNWGQKELGFQVGLCLFFRNNGKSEL